MHAEKVLPGEVQGSKNGTMRTTLQWVVAACLVGMLSSCGGKGGGGTDAGTNPPGGGGGSGAVQPGVIKGRVVDTRGQPVPGAGVYTGLANDNSVAGWVRTDAQGNYQFTKLALDVPYKLYAWVGVDYHGKKYCLRVSPETSRDYDSAGLREGAIRNFRWRLQGRMEDSSFAPEEDGSWYGGTIRLFTYFEDNDYKSIIELTLTPSGPLIDGSTGAVVTRNVDLQKSQFVLDIPAGAYKVSAARVKSDGTRVAARVGPSSSEGYFEYDFTFEPVQTSLECGTYGGTISGLDRGILYVLSP